MNRVLYIPLRLATDLVSIASRGINALFFWQEDYVKDAWALEVERARYVLQRLEGMR